MNRSTCCITDHAAAEQPHVMLRVSAATRMHGRSSLDAKRTWVLRLHAAVADQPLPRLAMRPREALIKLLP